MRYGYFDNEHHEYVVENPDTPMSWINYLGTSEFCSIISNNASGYSFYQSPKSGRITRFRFNSVPTDRPGRYLYIKDEADGDYWSATWQPVGKPLDQFKTICRHGMGYSKFISEYKGIQTELTIFVPIDKNIEVWDFKITNNSGKVRDLSIFSYVEWCFWEIMQDLINFQYILYVCRTDFQDDVIDYSMQFFSENEPKCFFSSGLPVTSFDTDRDVFIGNYRNEGNPAAVERGECFGSIAVGGNPCASVQNKIHLEPGQSIQTAYVLGIGDAKTDGIEYKQKYADRANIEAELAVIKEYWNSRLAAYHCETPSPEMNTMVNIWNQYQCHTTFNWSRSASFNEAGMRDGIGYRDTNQDTLGVVHAIPSAVRGKLLTMMKGQLACGAAMHSFQPLSWTQGSHNVPQDAHIYSDDHLWILLTIPRYIKETGDYSILDEVMPYADQGEDTVYNHLKKAIEFSNSKRGPHNLLLGLCADWNDCINLKGKGESVWSTQLFYLGLEEFIALAGRIGNNSDVKVYTELRDDIKSVIDSVAWDGEWFLRGYLDSGKKLGSQESDQSKIFLNSQTWSVVSGAADKDKGQSAMDSVYKYLSTEHGNIKNYPAYRKIDFEIGAVTSFPPGLKENGAIFCHANTWSIIAEAMLGRGDRAFEFYKSFLPAAKNDTADVYTMEPYVYAQFITGKEHPLKFGRARNSWLTGTASWSFVAASQYILGVRSDYDGLIIDPCIPHEWDGFKVQRIFRSKLVNIQVENPIHTSYGVKELWLNGEQISGKTIPASKLLAKNEVRVVMG